MHIRQVCIQQSFLKWCLSLNSVLFKIKGSWIQHETAIHILWKSELRCTSYRSFIIWLELKCYDPQNLWDLFQTTFVSSWKIKFLDPVKNCLLEIRIRNLDRKCKNLEKIGYLSLSRQILCHWKNYYINPFINLLFRSQFLLNSICDTAKNNVLANYKNISLIYLV